MRYIRIILCLFAVLQIAMPAFAEQPNTVEDCLKYPEKCKEQPAANDETERAAVQSASSVTFWDVFRLLAATAFVIFLLYALLRWLNKQTRFHERKGLIHHLGGTSVGTNRSIQVVKVGRRLLVVGVGDSIHLLKEITDEEEIREWLEQYEQRLNASIVDGGRWWSFVQQFAQSLTKRKKEPSFQRLFQRELEQLVHERKEAMDEFKKKGIRDDE